MVMTHSVMGTMASLHVRDAEPQRGRAPSEIVDGVAADSFASFTAVRSRLTWADPFATAAFVMGDAGIGWVSQFDGCAAIAIPHEGELRATPGFDMARAA
jgi:thiamine biosynthesis lipoprotein